MEKDKEKHQAELQDLQRQITSLTQTIQRNESVIIMLKQQLASKQKAEEVRLLRPTLIQINLCLGKLKIANILLWVTI